MSSHSEDEQRAIKTLEQTTRFTGERYEVGLLWREEEVKLPKLLLCYGAAQDPRTTPTER